MKIRSIIFLLIFCVPLLTAAVPDIVEKQSGNIPAVVEKIANTFNENIIKSTIDN